LHQQRRHRALHLAPSGSDSCGHGTTGAFVIIDEFGTADFSSQVTRMLSGASTMSTASPSKNPRATGAEPPFPQASLEYPGLESEMTPRPDFGDESYRGHSRLQGKVAHITGGDSGIGRAVALAFAREGADVQISYLNEHADAEETARVVQEVGRTAVLAPGDISDQTHCRSLVERTVVELGRLDILVNNAAFQMDRYGIEQIPDGEWEHTFRTNIFAMYYLCKAAWPHLATGSTIINTASIQAYQPTPQLLPYASTKGAIVTCSKALAQDGSQRGIRVNVVAPGPVWTPLIRPTCRRRRHRHSDKTRHLVVPPSQLTSHRFSFFLHLMNRPTSPARLLELRVPSRCRREGS
jgi:NAD(P)-dependent dehydrogenase (short-subunit alcohol dehydrogenase family)